MDKKFLQILIVVVLLFLVYTYFFKSNGHNQIVKVSPEKNATFWSFKAVDTMKMSRDEALSKLEDDSYDRDINIQVENIAKTGATHVAIATPYDDKFLPYLKRWVLSARKNNLKVWFRGNWSNWEGWFGFEEKMTFEEHLNKTVKFITNNPDIFEDGDYFTGCPECENGVMGDPRSAGNVKEFREFFIREYQETQKAFKSINKKVGSNLYSMNKDVADLVMNKETVEKTGGIITIDHYVKTPKQLFDDVNELNKKTGAKVVLGEYGVPIPDINGKMTEDEQAKWLDEALGLLVNNQNLFGLAYWVNKGGSTAIWSDDDKPTKAVDVLGKYYYPIQLFGTITNQRGEVVNDVIVTTPHKVYKSTSGEYLVGVLEGDRVVFSKDGYSDTEYVVRGSQKERNVNLTLTNTNLPFWQKLLNAFGM